MAIIAFSFLSVILIGSVLLSLPYATKEGTNLTYFDHLFTSTSATCVTGLFTVTEIFIDFKINDCGNVPDLVEHYIEFLNEERPAYALGYLAPKAYKEMHGPKNRKVSTKC